MTSSPLKVGLKPAIDGFPGGFQTIAINNNSGGKMEISFQRTIRVPDDGKNYQLPPDLGKFPIFSIDDYAEKLPVDIVTKGGGMTLILVLRLRGGFDSSNLSSWERKQLQKQMKREAEKMAKEEYDKNYELTLAPGGSIHQAIRKDYYYKDRYDEKNAVMFNVQFLAPKTFHLVTGTPPPQTPVSAETYARHGYPFFEIYNEPRAITGTFGELLKSVGDIDKEKNVNLEVHQRENGLHFRSVKLNTVDKMSQFYTKSALRKKNGQN
ncbi:hypothetical protein BCON_0177g00230 [Botryotinia convoluta]|uniref:Uncharacterized protein n=1 Tax=Botryotinia convoluta TaxID=54673 RepID=A0A4Z1HNS9_9HELO|nr:hypothetical protein BCON_0177g00230 [Botryotinia convoluta]